MACHLTINTLLLSAGRALFHETLDVCFASIVCLLSLLDVADLFPARRDWRRWVVGLPSALTFAV
jgi:hypothetical protein